jgi:hypothetical protein
MLVLHDHQLLHRHVYVSTRPLCGNSHIPEAQRQCKACSFRVIHCYIQLAELLQQQQQQNITARNPWTAHGAISSNNSSIQ